MLLAIADMSMFTDYFHIYELSLKSINDLFSDIEDKINKFISALNNKGASMSYIKLDPIENYQNLIETYNNNIAKLNKLLADIDLQIPTQVFNKQDLLATNIYFRNNSMEGNIKIQAENIAINWTDQAGKNNSLIIPSNEESS